MDVVLKLKSDCMREISLDGRDGSYYDGCDYIEMNKVVMALAQDIDVYLYRKYYSFKNNPNVHMGLDIKGNDLLNKILEKKSNGQFRYDGNKLIKLDNRVGLKCHVHKETEIITNTYRQEIGLWNGYEWIWIEHQDVEEESSRKVWNKGAYGEY